MDLFVALGISIGVLAGIWGEASGPLGLITWVAFVAWASFYAAGGKAKGLLKAVASNLSGVVWGVVIVFLSGLFGIPFSLGIALVIGAFMMCVQAHWSVLSFIPGAFAGCAVYFGTGTDWKGAAIALVIGAVLGYVSEIIGVALTKIGKKPVEKETTKPSA
jgi:hypothetical protein